MGKLSGEHVNKFIAAVAVVLAGAGQTAQAADVGVSVQISQPGVYGRIDIGRFPQPQVVVQQPVYVTRPVVVMQAAPPPPPQPVYMWVPPGHRKDWRKHCGRYNACGVPVYFVQDQWYGQNVHPEGKGKKGKYHDHGHGEDGGDGGDGHGKGKHKDKGKGKHGD
jgi:hypothetical protein